MLIIPIEKRIDWQQPPIALIAIIIINVFIFWFYQGLDELRAERAINAYQNNKLLQLELPVYQQYLNDKGLDAVDVNHEYIDLIILSDPNFTNYLDTHGESAILTDNYDKWKKNRNDVNQLWNKVSANAYGFKSADMSLFSMISYQFLHGDLMHLLGNMVFLFLIGFAVETALGSIKFTIFYLISGIGSALVFAGIGALTSSSGLVSLIGASGSVSGILAMYLVLFKFKKIEFFYWILIFVGYFRAIALIILPIYILKEVYFYLYDEGSNVAYTAHIGGFIFGAALITLTQHLNEKSINNDYLESNEEPVDPYAESLNQVYKLLGKCEFKPAWNNLLALIKQSGNNSELIAIQLTLIRALNNDKVKPFLLHHFGNTYSNPSVIGMQFEYWNQLTVEQQQSISFEKRCLFASDLLLINQSKTSEAIFNSLKNNDDLVNEHIAVLARKIAMFYQESDRSDIANDYNVQAHQLMQNLV